MELLNYKQKLKNLEGKVIAIVYTFTGDTLSEYYDAWKADVLSDWIRGVYDIKCIPLVMDFETFAFKAFNNTLPKIDYVINLNNGNVDLSSLGLLPSICSYLNLPCIPNNSEVLIIGENKFIANALAQSAGLKIPKYLNDDDPSGIIRPINYGSSKGIHRGNIKNNIRDLHQEFIAGFDMTMSFMYNPINNKLCFVSALMYLPDNFDINWYLGEEEKEKRNSYSKIPVRINESFYKRLEKIVNEVFAINTLCRIDTRVKCNSNEELLYFKDHEVDSERVHFLEINPLPTIKENVNFTDTILNTDDLNDFKLCLNEFQKYSSSQNTTGFILSCILLSNI